MDCLSCEIKRASLRAGLLSLVGRDLEAIAEDLSERYGASYYVTYQTDGAVYRRILWRASKIAPYTAVEITRRLEHFPT